MEHSIATANADAKKKSEKRGYIGGDYEAKGDDSFV